MQDVQQRSRCVSAVISVVGCVGGDVDLPSALFPSRIRKLGMGDGAAPAFSCSTGLPGPGDRGRGHIGKPTVRLDRLESCHDTVQPIPLHNGHCKKNNISLGGEAVKDVSTQRSTRAPNRTGATSASSPSPPANSAATIRVAFGDSVTIRRALRTRNDAVNCPWDSQDFAPRVCQSSHARSKSLLCL